MRFMLLVYRDEEAEASRAAAQQGEKLRRRLAPSTQWQIQGVMEDAEVLHPTSLSTTVRVRDGRMLLTDGPFAETQEQLSGYYIVSCANQEEALRVAAEVGEIHDHTPESIEVRPIWEYAAGSVLAAASSIHQRD